MPLFKKAKDIRIGVIGYGGQFNMGRRHLKEMQEAGMTPAAVADPDVERLKVAEEEYPGIETYRSVSAMLKKSDINLVVIITPHNTHAKLALQCLKADRHVVLEKPMGITTAECDAMIAEAKKRGLVLSTYHNRHWDGCILNAMKLIKSRAIGKVVRVQCQFGGRNGAGKPWRSSRSISGGILYDWGVHLVEYALQIVNDDIEEVSGFLSHGYWAKTSPWKKDTIEDEGAIVARFKNGAWLTLNMTHLDPDPDPYWFHIIGLEGKLSFSIKEWRLVKQEGGQRIITEGQSPPNEGWRFYKNIADHMVKGRKLVISPEYARRPIHIIDLACQSAKKGKAMKAKYK